MPDAAASIWRRRVVATHAKLATALRHAGGGAADGEAGAGVAVATTWPSAGSLLSLQVSYKCHHIVPSSSSSSPWSSSSSSERWEYERMSCDGIRTRNDALGRSRHDARSYQEGPVFLKTECTRFPRCLRSSSPRSSLSSRSVSPEGYLPVRRSFYHLRFSHTNRFRVKSSSGGSGKI